MEKQSENEKDNCGTIRARQSSLRLAKLIQKFKIVKFLIEKKKNNVFRVNINILLSMDMWFLCSYSVWSPYACDETFLSWHVSSRMTIPPSTGHESSVNEERAQRRNSDAKKARRSISYPWLSYILSLLVINWQDT